MQSAAFATQTAAELPEMLATLCSYENFFGPYHPQTLRLITEIGVIYWQRGDAEQAARVLERAVRDLGRFLGRTDEMRLEAIAILRDLYIDQRALGKAGALQKELWECQTERLGAQHPEAQAAHAALAAIMMQSEEHICTREA